MAKDDIKNKPTTSTDPNAEIELDFASYLLEGMTEKDLIKTGGLTPIYSSELAFTRKLNLVAGWIHSFEILPIDPTEANGKPRVMIAVCDIKKPTVGVTGPRTQRVEHNVDAGGSILVPMGGNLKVNKDLLRVLADTAHVYYGVFGVSGKKPVMDRNGKVQPSDMWVLDCRIAMDKKIARTGRYALTPAYVAAISKGDLTVLAKGQLPQTSSGQEYDPTTGVVIEQPQVVGQA